MNFNETNLILSKDENIIETNRGKYEKSTKIQNNPEKHQINEEYFNVSKRKMVELIIFDKSLKPFIYTKFGKKQEDKKDKDENEENIINANNISKTYMVMTKQKEKVQKRKKEERCLLSGKNPKIYSKLDLLRSNQGMCSINKKSNSKEEKKNQFLFDKNKIIFKKQSEKRTMINHYIFILFFSFIIESNLMYLYQTNDSYITLKIEKGYNSLVYCPPQGLIFNIKLTKLFI